MIAAVYARKSTEQNVPDEEKSVARQVERARAYAARKGWMVADAHVYADDGISGAEFREAPGLPPADERSAAAGPLPGPHHVRGVAPRPRNRSAKQISTLKQLAQAGVRVFLYLDDRERTIDSPTEKLLMSVTVVAAQAAVVRRVFALCDEGQGFTRVAKALNEDAVAPPRRSSGWAQTAAREILLRPLYRGKSSGTVSGSAIGGDPPVHAVFRKDDLTGTARRLPVAFPPLPRGSLPTSKRGSSIRMGNSGTLSIGAGGWS